MRTFYIRTFGCQMNEHDSEKMARLLMQMGLRPVDEPRRADLVIVNTCSVREKPEHKALSEAGRWRRARHAGRKLVVLAGCVAQQHGRNLLEGKRLVDAVVGPDAIGRLPEIIRRLAAGDGPVVDTGQHTTSKPDFIDDCKPVMAGPSAMVTIMKGCNNFCSYCIVPYVRGREVSRPAADILAEVESLAKAGCREVTLLGQNVNSYRDPSGVDFSELLWMLERQGAVDRIRFTTSHPRDLSDRMIDAVAECSRVCEHVHLGLQSGSNRILKAMNRGYTREHFLERAITIREKIPTAAITTDVIVGFCGETESDFQQTVDVVEKVGFDLVYSFKYSPRPLTRAFKMPDDVPAGVKAERLDRLHEVIDRVEGERLDKLVGTVKRVMVEGRSIRDDNCWTGRTRCNRVVNFTSERPLRPGQIVRVEITQSRSHTLRGRFRSG